MTTQPNDAKLRTMRSQGYVPAAEAAERLGVAVNTIYRWMDEGTLVGILQGKRFRWVSVTSMKRAEGRQRKKERWTTMARVRPGSLFITREGVLAVKTAARDIPHTQAVPGSGNWTPTGPAQARCIALLDGEQFGVADESEVRRLEPPAP